MPRPPGSGNPDLWKSGFGTRPKEVDDAIRQKGLEVRRENPVRWTKEKCINELNECLDILKKILKDDEKLEKDNPRKLKNESIRDITTLMNKFFDYMRYLYPPVQQNVNVNIDITAEAVIERLKNWKKKKLAEGEIIVEEVKEDA